MPLLREEFAKAGLEGKVWQYFTAVPDFRSVGVSEDGKRSFAYPVIIRAVNTVDAMTATIEEIPYDCFRKDNGRITKGGRRCKQSALRSDTEARGYY